MLRNIFTTETQRHKIFIGLESSLSFWWLPGAAPVWKKDPLCLRASVVKKS